MNCQEALNLLYDIIDKEASAIDVKEVQQHLDNCQDCFDKFRLHESVQALINERLKNSYDAPTVDHLKSKVLLRLDQIDSACSKSSARATPLRVPALVLAAAASFILLIGAGYFLMKLFEHYVEYIPIEREHWAAEHNHDGFTDTDKTQAVMAAVSRDYGFTLPADYDGFSLVGGQSKEVKGMNVAHFVYSDGDKSLSLFVVPASQLVIDDDLKDTKGEINGHCYYDHNCRGCRLVYYKNGEAVLITATTDHSFDLPSFDPAAGTI